jgi:hypothetical protein
MNGGRFTRPSFFDIIMVRLNIIPSPINISRFVIPAKAGIHGDKQQTRIPARGPE